MKTTQLYTKPPPPHSNKKISALVFVYLRLWESNSMWTSSSSCRVTSFLESERRVLFRTISLFYRLERASYNNNNNNNCTLYKNTTKYYKHSNLFRVCIRLLYFFIFETFSMYKKPCICLTSSSSKFVCICLCAAAKWSVALLSRVRAVKRYLV